MRQSTANELYVKRQVSVIRVYTCSERHLTFRRNIDTRRQWSVGNIGCNEWLYWEIVINDHCHGSVYFSVYTKIREVNLSEQIYTTKITEVNSSAFVYTLQTVSWRFLSSRRNKYTVYIWSDDWGEIFMKQLQSVNKSRQLNFCNQKSAPFSTLPHVIPEQSLTIFQ